MEIGCVSRMLLNHAGSEGGKSLPMLASKAAFCPLERRDKEVTFGEP